MKRNNQSIENSKSNHYSKIKKKIKDSSDNQKFLFNFTISGKQETKLQQTQTLQARNENKPEENFTTEITSTKFHSSNCHSKQRKKHE